MTFTIMLHCCYWESHHQVHEHVGHVLGRLVAGAVQARPPALPGDHAAAGQARQRGAPRRIGHKCDALAVQRARGGQHARVVELRDDGRDLLQRATACGARMA